ncbi:MAG: putative peptide maturation dehydrogenase [Blastocatellia bacterium]|nr:putative peptide maturation dehydrogenase [Blastocatellia bacterium]
MRSRRSSFVFFYAEDNIIPDLNAFLQGQLSTKKATTIWALSAIYGKPCAIEKKALEVFLSFSSSEWTNIEKSEISDILRLASIGLLLVDDDSEIYKEYLRREQKLYQEQWNVYAAIYHFLNKWKDFHSDRNIPTNLQELSKRKFLSPKILSKFVSEHGKPPEHFHKLKDTQIKGTQTLPLKKEFVDNDPFLQLLKNRRTCREFDDQVSISQEVFSKLLYTVFGCQGKAHVYEDIWGIKRTSPSGGGLHPIEAYVLVINIEGITPGIYHYDTEEHKLNAIEYKSITEARELANEFTAGQSYPRLSSALCIMTARFYRNYWKYRRHPKAYPVLYMDCAHLSQTFYLACSYFKLGSFVTGAINTANIEEHLRLDPYSESPLLICGCGIGLEESIGLDPVYTEVFPPNLSD